ncbi:sigma-70 family RNA polymerase sigma factor [Niabella pedocola]|uniref:Sigma-70 family RNA polymerase sigma factor n=1 Tax=Niabella pedocola TaxID=1752077 RepID=A0ABS8PTB3_9BACT|nr:MULTISPECIES: sigma-70 family RNA polymerase sigma factor [Niabella]MBZ4189317.1 sigma-70 family RNA polymerase sigma factor [Niabella beijingensis]MCD2424316.1 sigma-70 family RNA polymerase sigma factor [Niabella pedocola]
MFKRLALGDESALHQIIDNYGDELLARIFRVVHNRYWAEEIQMDVFLELWEQREKVSLMAHPKAWLLKVAYNKTVDRLRKEIHYIPVPLEYLEDTENKGALDDEISLDELTNIIAAAIEELPPKEKRVYILSTEERWSIKKIAEVLGRSPNTIRNELVIARKSIRKIVSNYLHLFLF